MKIQRLNLLAFGPFTGATLDFGASDHGLQIVYGPNEAGKSSSLRAVTNLLFGFPTSTDDNFVHPYPKLRIGGTLRHSDGTELKFIRRKAKKNTLRCGDDKDAVPESTLTKMIGEIDRSMFRMRFGFNHQRLVDGGQKIASGSGDIGQLLFAAGAGTGALQQTRDDLQQAGDALLKPSLRSGSIVETIKQYQELRKKVAAAQTSVETWNTLRAKLERTAEAREKLIVQIRELRTDQSRLIRINNVIPAVVSYKELNARLAAVADAPSLDENFSRQSQKAITELAATTQQAADSTSAIEALSKDIAQVEVSQNLLDEAAAIETLRDRVGQYNAWKADRPKLTSKVETLERDIADMMIGLGQQEETTDISQLAVPNDKSVRIQELGIQREGLLERDRASQSQLQKLQREKDSAETALAGMAESVDAAALKRTLDEALRRGDLEAELAELHREIAARQSELEQRLGRLSLWRGTVSELAELPVPLPATISKFDGEFEKANQRLTRLDDQMESVNKRREQSAEILVQLERDQAVATLEQLQQIRNRRDAGWRLVCDAWKQGRGPEEPDDAATAFAEANTSAVDLPDAVGQSIRQADHIADSLRSDANRVAQKSQLESELATCQSNLKQLADQRKLAVTDLKTVLQQWRDVWKSTGIEPLTPDEMTQWSHEFLSLREQSQSLDVMAAKGRRIEQEVDELKQRLHKQLNQPSANLSLDQATAKVSEQYETIRNANSQREQLTKQLSSVKVELADAQQAADEAKGALETWQASWAIEMTALGLEEVALPSQANMVLNTRADLLTKHSEAKSQKRRIQYIDRDTKAFVSEVSELTARIAPELSELAADQTIGLLSSKLQSARDADTKKRSLASQLDSQLKLNEDRSQKLATLKSSLQQMCALAQCKSADQLMSAAEASRDRDSLKASVAETERQIIQQSGGQDLETFLADVETERGEADSLPPRIKELEDEIEALEHQRDELTTTMANEDNELKQLSGGDTAAQYQLDCESSAAKLEDEFRQLAVLKVASGILTTGIERYRKKNQGPVLERASEMFGELTLGGFTGLRAEFDDRNQPELRGVRAGDSETLSIAGMSDGTCDQLYLALRLASLEMWMADHEPMPLVMDDVLMNFDDARTVATLKVLARLSRQTQIIYFTHHQHVVDLARESVDAKDLHVTEIEQAVAPS